MFSLPPIRPASYLVLSSILFGAFCVQSARSSDVVESLAYVPPADGLTKIFQRSVEGGPGSVVTNVYVMDETRNGLTAFFIYGLRNGSWVFERFLTACDFFNVYRERAGDGEAGLAADEALRRCDDTWPLTGGQAITLPDGTHLDVESIGSVDVLIDGTSKRVHAYTERRFFNDGRSAVRSSAQGIGTFNAIVGEGLTFSAVISRPRHPAQGHILGRCLADQSLETCLCLADGAHAWLNQETLEAVLDNVRLDWHDQEQLPVRRGVRTVNGRVDGYKALSQQRCGASIATYIY